MATTRPAVLAMLVLAAGISAPAQIPPLPTPTSAVPILQEIVATQAFEERVIQYVTLHRLLEGPLPQLRVDPGHGAAPDVGARTGAADSDGACQRAPG